VLRKIHISAHGIGRFFGLLTLFGMVLVVFAVPIFAAVMVALYLGVTVAKFLGFGIVVGMLFCSIFIAIIGIYISPYVQPQITAALHALLVAPRTWEEQEKDEQQKAA